MDRLDNSTLEWFHGHKDSGGGGDSGSGSGSGGAGGADDPSMRWSLGDVQIVVLMRCMQAEATRTKWKSNTTTNARQEDSYLCDNLSAILSNLAPHCVHIHSSVANRMIHLFQVLTRRLRWAARRTKEISGIEIKGNPEEINRIVEEYPILGCIIKCSAGTLRPEAVFNGWQQQEEPQQQQQQQHDGTENNGTRTNQHALDELKHLEIQASITSSFLKVVLELFNACLATKALQHNVHVLYALLYSSMTSSASSASSSSSSSSTSPTSPASSTSSTDAHRYDLLSPFRDKTIATEYEYNTKTDQETHGLWALDLCRSSDPLTDVVGFMRLFLDQKQQENGGNGWVDVATVMVVLEGGVRTYRTQRASQDAAVVSSGGGGNGGGSGGGNGSAEQGNMERPAFEYEELDGASAFFLPYSWSLVLDMSRELNWDTSRVELFPMVPLFLEDALLETLLENDGVDGVEEESYEQERIGNGTVPEIEVVLSKDDGEAAAAGLHAPL
jgi:hypothetical protein